MRRRTRLTIDLQNMLVDDDIESQVISLYKSGTSVQDIIDELGVSSSSLYSYLNKNDITLRTSKIKTKNKNRVVKLYAQGESVESIANKTGIGKTSVYNTLRDNGIKFNNYGTRMASNYHKKYDRHIIELRLKGMSNKKIAEAMNNEIGATYVNKVSNSAGLHNKSDIDMAISAGITVDDLIDSDSHITPFNSKNKYDKAHDTKFESDHDVDNYYIENENKDVPGFWKRLKYAFSANKNDLKD